MRKLDEFSINFIKQIFKPKYEKYFKKEKEIKNGEDFINFLESFVEERIWIYNETSNEEDKIEMWIISDVFYSVDGILFEIAYDVVGENNPHDCIFSFVNFNKMNIDWFLTYESAKKRKETTREKGE